MYIVEEGTNLNMILLTVWFVFEARIRVSIKEPNS